MRVLDVRAVVERVFRETGEFPVRVDGLRFIHRHLVDVYLVESGGSRFIAHVAVERPDELVRQRANLERLAQLGLERLPRVVGWQEGNGWAVLVSTHVPGGELSPRNWSPAVWSELSKILELVHRLPAEADDPDVAPRVHHPEAFASLAQSLGHTAGINNGSAYRSLSRLLGEMADYLDHNREVFARPARLIHGDITRSNIQVEGAHAGLVDWADLGPGDYAYDLAMLKFTMDSVRPRDSARLLRDQARAYRSAFADDTIELRMRFYLALGPLTRALAYAMSPARFELSRGLRVRTCILYAEAQWRSPLRLDGPVTGAPAALTEHSPLHRSLGKLIRLAVPR